MESDDRSPPSSFESNPIIDFKKMSAENQRRIDATDSLINNSAIQAIVDKFSLDNFAKNHPLADDIENGVKELIKENNKLKDALLSNNVSVKRLFTTVDKWLEDVHASHRNNFKKKLDEATEVIGKLNNENSELKKSRQDVMRSVDSKFVNEKLLNENQLLRDRLVSMQHKLCKYEQLSASQLKREHDLNQCLTSLEKKYEDVEKSRRKLFYEVDRLNHQEMKLQEILSNGDSTNVTNACYWNAMFPAVKGSSPREIQLMENFKELEVMLQPEEVTAGVPNQNLDSISDSWVDVNISEKDKRTESLKEEVSVLRRKLLEEQAASILCRKLLDEVRAKFKIIHQQSLAILKEHDCKMRAQNISLIKARENAKNIASYKDELNNHIDRVVRLELELAAYKKKLDEKTSDYFFLQTQVRTYEEDYNSVRQTNDLLQDEKRRLENSLHLLKLENKKLLEQIQASVDSELNNATMRDPTVTTSQYVCINETCGKSFASAEDLQTHIYSCLNLKD